MFKVSGTLKLIHYLDMREEEKCNEGQEMVDTRFAIIFQEIASLLEGQGETLFKVIKKDKSKSKK